MYAIETTLVVVIRSYAHLILVLKMVLTQAPLQPQRRLCHALCMRIQRTAITTRACNGTLVNVSMVGTVW
jgi:hypothetical protein